MIVSAGYNIAAPEVEEVAAASIRRWPNARSSACPTSSAARSSRRSWCLRAGHAPGEALVRELQEHVKASVAPYKYPRAVEFRDSLPRTETGKLQRFKLRQPA